MRNILLPGLFFWSSILLVQGSCAAQQKPTTADSLLSRLVTLKEDTAKVNLLGKLAIYYLNVDPDQGLLYGQKSLRLSFQLNWKKGEADAYSAIAHCYLNKSNYKGALEYYEKALDMDEELSNDADKILIYIDIGGVYDELSNYPKALEYYFSALKMAEDQKRTDDIGYCQLSIGTLFKSQQNYITSLSYLFKGLSIFETSGNKTGMTKADGAIGIVYFLAYNYDSALFFLNRALSISRGLDDKMMIAQNLENIGNIYSEKNDNSRALDFQFQALQLYRQINNQNGLANILGNIGITYFNIANDTTQLITADSILPGNRAGNLQKAIEFLEQAIIIENKIGDLNNLQQFYENLSEAYAMAGRYEDAYETHKKFVTVKDSVFSTQKTIKIAQLLAQKETEIKNKEIRFSKLKFRFSIAAVFVLMVFVGFFYRNLKIQKLSNRKLGISNKKLSFEKQKSDKLLRNILPVEVAEELKKTGSAKTRFYEDVTVMFTDFVNFTEAGERMTPKGLVDELNECFKAFDSILDRYNIEKIKTIGDAYMVVSGLPVMNIDHALHVVAAAIDIRDFMKKRKVELGDRTFAIRIGIHTGSVVAGIVGTKKFAYDIWGDTVNTAARLEQHSEPGKINISQTTWQLVKDNFECAYRGKIHAKNKGTIDMYFVNASRNNDQAVS